MTLRMGNVVLSVADLGRATVFWAAALGYVRRDEHNDDFIVLVPPGGGQGIALQPSEATPPDVPHVHLDLYAPDAVEQAEEVERLVGLGATRVGWHLYPEDPNFVVLADPDGNRFCVVDASRGA